MHSPCILAVASILPFLASAHMRMLEPLPINSPDDLEVPENLKDYGYTAPLDPTGSDFPCKGYHKEDTSHISKATYQAGGDGKLIIQSNYATHGGGSCQISLSYDNGVIWKVIKSMIGGCPVTLDYDFKIPKDAPPSNDTLLAWTWYNLVGNREMYMNCARVTIEGPPAGRHRRSRLGRRNGVLSGLPDMFTCNIGHGCTTKEGQNVDFPEPGEDVTQGENSMATQPGTGFDGASDTSGSSGAPGMSNGSVNAASLGATLWNISSTSSTTLSTSDGTAHTSVLVISTQAVPTGDDKSYTQFALSAGSAVSSSPVQAPSTSVPLVTASILVVSAFESPASASATPADDGPCRDGTIICDSITTWSMCAHGAPVSMGSVANGTICVDGNIS